MRRSVFSYPYIVWMLLFILSPMILIFYYAFTGEGGFTLQYLVSALGADNLTVLWDSIRLALYTTVICLLLGYPVALMLSRMRKATATLLSVFFIVPMWMNFLLRTLAWQTLLEKNGVINGILNFLHLPNITIINTPWAIILGMVYNFLPFMVLPIYNVLIKIDKNLIHAARDLGANGVKTFLHVTLPLSISGVISGITMVFVPALTTFVISRLLGGNKILLIGNVIEQEFTVTGNWHLGSGLSIVLMLFIIFNMVLSVVTDKDGEANAI